MEIMYKDSNRVAQIFIPYEAQKDDREKIAALMSILVVLKAEPHENGRGTAFFVACDKDCTLFEPLKEGENVPEYRLSSVYDQKFEQEDHEARRVNVGLYGFVAVRKTIIRVPPASMVSGAIGARVH